ncbi:peptidase [Streptomyces umbrinus]|uniref:S8 family peptidase n=1 Tax=Streptomyces umbrinus TaxID=67370 RepID=UPI00167669EF|nr:S8 family serine peptidase [Streptomyces umbrinus]GHB59057.1 peptidase [Streptomyces umbrinus]
MTLAVAVLTGAATLITPAASAQPTAAGETPAEKAPGKVPGKAVTTHHITLVTGDTVTVTTRDGDRSPAIVLDPAGPSRGTAQVRHTDDATYVVPAAANEALADNAVDPALFDVDALIADGYDDASADTLPVLVQSAKDDRLPVAPAVARVTTRLESIDALGARIPKQKAARFWRAQDTAEERAKARIGKIWLDAKVQADLAQSVPQIGAPQLWASGYDGKGVKVAVLDTGVDTAHPDLKGRVSEARNFTNMPDALDHFGHGTHVAATIGGSGTGNGAKGVAPGADIVSGKVLGDDGNGTYSSIISGMEWAAEEGADIANMSLGTSSPDDGYGPLSSAVNRLSETYGTLFVVASGNFGPNTLGEPASAADALTVGAVDRSDALAPFSSTGPRKGDYAIKPEVTAPGVDIVAARAAGTTMGTPVDELYTKASGTSMATPHTAGAAALLKQAHPAWSAQRLKAALVSSAEPGPYRADQGGAGRIDVPRAEAQQAYATPATLDLGPVRYAQDGAYEPVRGELTLHNDAARDTVFTLTASGSKQSGQAIPAGALSLPDGAVTVPAGTSTKVTLTVDPNLLTREAPYSGVVTAVAGDSSASLRVPFSVYLEPVLHELKVTGIGTDGAPAGGPSQIVLLRESGDGPYSTTVNFRGGVATARVKPGVYTVQTTIYTPDASSDWIESATLSYRAQVDLTTDDTAYTLDARKAEEVRLGTDRRTELLGSAVAYRREISRGTYHAVTTLVSPDVKQLRLFPSDAPASGTQQVAVHTTHIAPQLTATARGVSLTPTQLDGALMFEGRRILQLADVGTGTEEAFRRGRVKGRLVLVTKSELPLAEVIERAAARGAAAVAITRAGPGRLVAEAGSRALPAFALHGEQGAALSRLGASRTVTVTLHGTPYSPYVYNLVTPFTGSVPEGGLRLPADAAHTARTTARNYARGTTDGRAVFSTRRKENPAYVINEVPARLGAVQEQWTSADPGTLYLNGIALPGTSLSMWDRTAHAYTAGSRTTAEWLRAPNNPRIDPTAPSWFRQSSWNGSSTLTVAASPFPDTDPAHMYVSPWDDTSSLTLSRDGEQVGKAGYWYANFAIPAERHRYTAVLEASRALSGWEFGAHSTTTWTFDAGGSSASSEPIQMPRIAYDVETGLDNRIPVARPQPMTVDTRSWLGAGTQTVKTEVWASHDDGRTWRPLALKPTATPGTYETQLKAPRTAASGHVGLRTKAVDALGNEVEQTVDRVFGIAAR